MPLPLPRRGRGSRLAGSRVAGTSLPRARAHSPKSAGRGTQLLSHAQRLTRRRHSSEQVTPEPEQQADFRSGKWLQERAGGDARDSQQALLAGMGSRHRSVFRGPAGPGRLQQPRCGFQSSRSGVLWVPACGPAYPPGRGALGTGRLATVSLRALPGRGWTRPRGGPKTGPPRIGQSP